MTSPSIGVAFITHTAKSHLPRCLPPVLSSPLRPRVLVVNSSSNDGTVELAQELGAETLVIPRREFNHGTTRELARKHLGTDIVVLMTPDAYALGQHTLGNLVAPLLQGEASVAYARQIPHDGADLFEAFPRTFNYPDQSQLRGASDADRYGVYTIFCSDTCAAYVQQALDEIGGFKATLTAEDTFAVAELLQRGHRIAYVADATVKHSHRYTLVQEFKRYFDTGLVRKEHERVVAAFGSDQRRGAAFVRGLLRTVAQENPALLPYAVLQTAVKWLGYRVGTISTKAPPWLKRTLSSQDYYWTSDAYLRAAARDEFRSHAS